MLGHPALLRVSRATQACILLGASFLVALRHILLRDQHTGGPADQRMGAGPAHIHVSQAR